jgi:hypothetical protein
MHHFTWADCGGFFRPDSQRRKTYARNHPLSLSPFRQSKRTPTAPKADLRAMTCQLWRFPFATTVPNQTSLASKLPSLNTAHKSAHPTKFSQRSLVASSRPPLLALVYRFGLPSQRYILARGHADEAQSTWPAAMIGSPCVFFVSAECTIRLRRKGTPVAVADLNRLFIVASKFPAEASPFGTCDCDHRF